MTEPRVADVTLATFMQNALLVNQGVVNPLYRDLPPLYNDPTSPLTSAESISKEVTNVVPNPNIATTSAKTKSQSKADIQKMLMSISTKTGFLFENIHLEDLNNISSNIGEVTERDIWMYIRGAMMTNQVSSTTALTKLIGSVEAILLKNQQSMTSSAESNKLLSERMTVLGTKIDTLAPAICATIQTEHEITREKVIPKKVEMIQVAPPLELSTLPKGKLPLFPREEEIIRICLAANCPPDYAENIAKKYVGKVNWDEYQSAISGNLTPMGIKQIVASWKTRY
ncbi:TPA_asm: P [Cypripedium gammacytorhabdovirus 1]|nr:TPA_asm: P [Cypripedium gammacytorhabdovirus 1]